ncbi:myosin heavy chain kinase B-like [Quillaja saponaria]|uniref:Myosin heavy chain kinase B-like n=1 Tax=Quillaja saponaria TaxID=32244 RepID=A0AAD7KML5_QUISA|nr:myosin heavy chain kinase B-like [Quillaja saponaria]
MEFHPEKDLCSFGDEEKSKTNLPQSLCFSTHQRVSEHNVELASARPSSASATSISSQPMSPKTPWLLSPVRLSPSPPLLYHCLASLHRQEGNIFSITVSKDFVFTGSESSRIHAWKQPDGTDMGYIKANSGQVRAILAQGKMLFTSHGDYRIRIWHLPLVENFIAKKITTLPPRSPFFFFPRKTIHQHRDHISCLAYNQEDKLLYSGSWDKTVKVWKVSEKSCIDSFVAHDGHVNVIVVNQEDGCVFTCSSDGSVKIWRRVYGENSHILTTTLRFQLSPVNALALSLSSSNCLLYSGSTDGLINFWEKEYLYGRYNHGGFLQGHHFAVLCLVAIGDLIFSGSEDATIRVWRRQEENCFHSCLSVIEGHHGPVRCLAVSLVNDEVLKGLLVYTASLDQTFKVWRVKVFPTENGNKESTPDNQKRDITESEINPTYHKP